MPATPNNHKKKKITQWVLYRVGKIQRTDECSLKTKNHPAAFGLQ